MCVFFFKQKTAYELRISDWSSDVCSSDLRALALAALVDRDGGVVDYFKEGHNTLAFAVGALDVAAQGAHRRPVVAQPAGILGQQCVFLDGVVDADRKSVV